MGDEHVRLCCFLGGGEEVDDDEVESLGRESFSLVEWSNVRRGISPESPVRIGGTGWPNPMPVSMAPMSKMPRANDRSVANEEIDEDDEPKQSTRIPLTNTTHPTLSLVFSRFDLIETEFHPSRRRRRGRRAVKPRVYTR